MWSVLGVVLVNVVVEEASSPSSTTNINTEHLLLPELVRVRVRVNVVCLGR